MHTVATAILPVFLLIFLGYGIRRTGLIAESFWRGAEQLTYFVLLPCLIVATLADSNLAGLHVASMAGAVVAAVLLVTVLVIALKPILRTDGPGFTSAFQASIRTNAYVALAIASALHGAQGIAAVAVAVAAAVPLVNILSVAALARYGDGAAPTAAGIAIKVVGNPLIIACLLGFGLNLAGLGLPPVIKPMAEILARAALGLALLSVGAGLEFAAVHSGGRALLAASVLKLSVMPAIVALGCWFLAVGPVGTTVAVLFCATPTATSGYIMARQMGGDAELMARLLTIQTAFAIVTLPLVLLFLT